VRLLLFPLFVKQIKSQRRMQELAPKIKELQKLHKGDRETLNTEMMKLYKDQRPTRSRVPAAAPAAARLLRPVHRRPRVQARRRASGSGLSPQLLGGGRPRQDPGRARRRRLQQPRLVPRGARRRALTVRLVAALMVVGMGASTFYTQKQMMARAGTVTDRSRS
jgi:YidC/Oxa1 family membrane protein insertase